MLTRAKILKLRPEFKFGKMTMVDWFQITEGGSFITIRNGLRHADGKTKSPFYYEDSVVGKNSKKIALERFNAWWTLKKRKHGIS